VTYQPSYVDLRALDLAYTRYHGAAILRGHARDDMVAAGVSRPEAERLLNGRTIPSTTYAMPRRPR
jgi:hypothetical protein